jgi:hypothetical protein
MKNYVEQNKFHVPLSSPSLYPRSGTYVLGDAETKSTVCMMTKKFASCQFRASFLELVWFHRLGHLLLFSEPAVSLPTLL